MPVYISDQNRPITMVPQAPSSAFGMSQGGQNFGAVPMGHTPTGATMIGNSGRRAGLDDGSSFIAGPNMSMANPSATARPIPRDRVAPQMSSNTLGSGPVASGSATMAGGAPSSGSYPMSGGGGDGALMGGAFNSDGTPNPSEISYPMSTKTAPMAGGTPSSPPMSGSARLAAGSMPMSRSTAPGSIPAPGGGDGSLPMAGGNSPRSGQAVRTGRTANMASTSTAPGYAPQYSGTPSMSGSAPTTDSSSQQAPMMPLSSGFSARLDNTLAQQGEARFSELKAAGMDDAAARQQVYVEIHKAHADILSGTMNLHPGYFQQSGLTQDANARANQATGAAANVTNAQANQINTMAPAQARYYNAESGQIEAVTPEIQKQMQIDNLLRPDAINAQIQQTLSGASNAKDLATQNKQLRDMLGKVYNSQSGTQTKQDKDQQTQDRQQQSRGDKYYELAVTGAQTALQQAQGDPDLHSGDQTKRQAAQQRVQGAQSQVAQALTDQQKRYAPATQPSATGGGKKNKNATTQASAGNDSGTNAPAYLGPAPAVPQEDGVLAHSPTDGKYYTSVGGRWVEAPAGAGAQQ